MLKRLTTRERRVVLAVLAALVVGALVQWVRSQGRSESVEPGASTGEGVNFFRPQDTVFQGSEGGEDSFA